MPEYRRRLPHFQPDGAYVFLTWRLWGSLLPQARSTTYRTAGHAFVAWDRALHGGACGPAWLGCAPIADLVARAILIGEDERQFYELCSWVVMPNHVHLLILPKVPVAVLMRWLKGSTARSANQILCRIGQPFWQDESYDHYLRDSSQIGRITEYIEQNPVSAGLALCPEAWLWSSAGWQAEPHAPSNLLVPPTKV